MRGESSLCWPMSKLLRGASTNCSAKPFQDLTARIDRETDAAKRMALVREAELIMEKDPPLLVMGWETINDVWYNKVKGHNPYEYFGLFDCWRLDTFWLDS